MTASHFYICEHCGIAYEIERATNNYSLKDEKVKISTSQKAPCPICGTPMFYAPNHDVKYYLCESIDNRRKAETNRDAIYKHVIQRSVSTWCTCEYDCSECGVPHDLGKCLECKKFKKDDCHECTHCGACDSVCQKGDCEGYTQGGV